MVHADPAVYSTLDLDVFAECRKLHVELCEAKRVM